VVLGAARRRMSGASEAPKSVLVVGSSQDARAIAERFADRGYAVVFAADRRDLVARAGDAVDAREVRFDDGSGLAALDLSVDAAFVAATRDRTNLLVARTLRARGEVGELVVRVNDPDREEIFADLGAETVCQTSLLAPAVETALGEA
jgi:Trk K+ transport system NAD-binding subunit